LKKIYEISRNVKKIFRPGEGTFGAAQSGAVIG
jgi:hypothetical protein